MEARTIHLRYVNIRGLEAELLLLDVVDPARGLALKLRLLSALGITPLEGETPLDAWARVMHLENGLTPERPAHPALAAAVLGHPDAARFAAFLA